MADILTILDNLLDSHHISGAKMCADLGMSRSFMTELRKGRAKSITVETADKIAKYFDVPVDYLLGKEEKTPTVTGEQKENPDQLVLTGIEEEMIKLFRQFPGVEQKLLVIMMQNLYSVPADTRGPALETLQAFWKTIQKP
jgi:transcriptional regulator with XRE-family HTH domain